MAAAAAEDKRPLRFLGNQKCFKIGGTVLPGLLKLLQRRFYPHYSYTAAKHNVDRSSGDTEYKRRQEKKKKHKRAIGVDLGMALDKHITQTVDILRRHPEAPLCIFYDMASTKVAPLSKEDKSTITATLVQTRAFWKAMDSLRLRPLATQVPVMHSHKGFRYATAVDVVCMNKQGEHILVECKSGFTGYYTNCTRNMMSAPLDQLTDSLANQHQIQLSATKEMYQNTFPEHHIGDCLIIHIEGSKVSAYPLKPWTHRVQSWAKLLFSA
jgi:hypothetical protein